MIEYLTNPYILSIIIVWSMFWKGWALWRAGNKKEKLWFIALFIVNTLGILEIIYLFLISKQKKRKK